MINMTNSFLDNIGLSDTNSLKHLSEKISPETDNEVDLDFLDLLKTTFDQR